MRIISPTGEERCKTTAFFVGNMFIIDDMSADMEPGDELRRTLPNGKDDVFEIADPKHFNTGGIAPHYQVHVSRKGAYVRGTGGHYIAVTGNNARVNLDSTDNSTNIVHSQDIFADLRQAIDSDVSDAAQRKEMLEAVREVEAAQGTSGFLSAYQRLIGTAADHVSIIAPFLPALSAII